MISEWRLKVRKVDLDEEHSNFEWYDRSEGNPVHVERDKEIAEGNKPTLALLPNRSEEDEIATTVKYGIGTAIMIYAGHTDYLNHRND